jgi:hypothetical protein
MASRKIHETGQKRLQRPLPLETIEHEPGLLAKKVNRS